MLYSTLSLIKKRLYSFLNLVTAPQSLKSLPSAISWDMLETWNLAKRAHENYIKIIWLYYGYLVTLMERFEKKGKTEILKSLIELSIFNTAINFEINIITLSKVFSDIVGRHETISSVKKLFFFLYLYRMFIFILLICLYFKFLAQEYLFCPMAVLT